MTTDQNVTSVQPLLLAVWTWADFDVCLYEIVLFHSQFNSFKSQGWSQQPRVSIWFWEDGMEIPGCLWHQLVCCYDYHEVQWHFLTEKTHCENRQKSKKQSRNLSKWSPIAQIGVASADVGVVFFHDSLIAVVFGVFLLFVFFPGTSSDYSNLATDVLVDFTAHCCLIWNSVFCLDSWIIAIFYEVVGINKFTTFGVITEWVITLCFMHTIAYVTTYSFSIAKDKKHGQSECQHT